MRPVIRALERRGARVDVTARDFAQTLGLLERFGIAHEAIGHHRGGRLRGEGRSGWRRARSRSRTGPRGSASTPRSATARTTSRSRPSCSASRARRRSTTSGRPSSTTSTAGSRGASSCPDAIPPERLAPLRRDGGEAARATRGSRRSTTWRTSSPTRRCSTSSGSTRRAPLAVVRTPPAVSLYHRFEHPLFGAAARRGCASRRRSSSSRARPSSAPSWSTAGGYVVPERAIDAQSLVAYADLVVSAGGTMNREAVALGTPVWTTFEGRLGAVDERLIAEGRLRRLERAEDVDGRARAAGSPPATACGAIRRSSPTCWSSGLARGPGGAFTRVDCRGCAGGSARRPPSRSTATASPRWRWTPVWSRSPTTSPTSSASTARSPRSTRTCSRARSAFVIVGSVFVFALFGLYRHWMRYATQRDYLQIAAGRAVVATLALLGLRRGRPAAARRSTATRLHLGQRPGRACSCSTGC